MTSNSKESATMGPLQERHHTSALSRRSCLVTSQSRLMTSRMRRRPARRALFELGHNDRRIERRRNFAFAENLLTIPVSEFKKKWNFDPVKMKPTNQIVSDNSVSSPDKITTDKTDETIIPRYEWRLMNENTEKKALEKTLCALAPNSARSMRLSYLALRNNFPNETPVHEEDINSTYVNDTNTSNDDETESSCEISNSSIEFNSTDTSFESQSSAEKLHESELLTGNVLDSLQVKPQEALPAGNSSDLSTGKPLPAVNRWDTENKEGGQKSISVVTNDKDNNSSSGGSSTACIDPVPTENIPVTAQSKNTSMERNTKQLKITDFACQRKRVHSDALVTSDNPPTKRLRPLI